MNNKYLVSNNALWDEMAIIHKESYTEIDSILKGESIIRKPEKTELGNIRGKTLLHMQCHIGTDSISLAYEGAIVTGTDFSEKSIDIARELAAKVSANINFLVSSNDQLTNNISNEFDIVYTSRGILCWNDDLNAWANTIKKMMKPGGFFYMQESHPISAILNENNPDIIITHPYFHTDKPIEWKDNYDYSRENKKLHNVSYEWTWSLSDVINSLINAGLSIEFVNEFDYTFYKAYDFMIQNNNGYWYIPKLKNKFPLMFSLKAKK